MSLKVSVKFLYGIFVISYSPPYNRRFLLKLLEVVRAYFPLVQSLYRLSPRSNEAFEKEGISKRSFNPFQVLKITFHPRLFVHFYRVPNVNLYYQERIMGLAGICEFH